MSGGATFLPAGPTRVLDTRSGLGGSGQTVLSHAAAVTRVMTGALAPVEAVRPRGQPAGAEPHAPQRSARSP